MRFTRAIPLLLLALWANAAHADPDALLDRLVKARHPGYVFDYAGVMRADDIRAAESTLRLLEQKTGAQVKVVALKSLEGGEINDFANRLFERWGIGQKGKDNGVLLLAAVADRKVRIEVGYGLEPVLTDAATGRLLDTYVIPAFRQGDLSGGLRAGAGAIAATVAQAAGVAWNGAPSPARAPPRGRRGVNWFGLIIAILFVLFAIRHPWLAMMLMMNGGRGGGFGGGGFGGGGGFSGGGFGGGLSGGGGASRGW